MSSIKTTQLDGDVSVGRNVAMGGKLDVSGSATIGHNLKVDGWLEAANIKGINKGIFLTVEELRSAYPNPHDGWLAGVGSSTPFTAYVGKGGDWVASGGTIEVTVDMSQYTEGVSQLQEDIDNVKADVKTNATNISSHTQQLTSLGNLLNTTTETANNAKSQSDTNKTDIANLKTAQETLQKQHNQDVSTLSNGHDTLQKQVDADIAKGYRLAGFISPADSYQIAPAEQTAFSYYAPTEKSWHVEDGATEGAAGVVYLPPAGYTVGDSAPDDVTSWTRIDTNNAEYNGYPLLFAFHSGAWIVYKMPYTWKQDFDAFKSTKGVANGLATLDDNGKLSKSEIPDSAIDVEMVSKWGSGVTTLGGPTGDNQHIYDTDTKTLYKSSFWTAKDGSKGYKWVEEAKDEHRIYVSTSDNTQYRSTGTDMVQIAAKDSPASIFNATNEEPLTGGGYYVLCDTEDTTKSAVHAAWNNKKAVSGLIISFEVGSGIWKTYQYIGKTVTETNWYNPDNWKDFGSLAAGSETYIIIDQLIGAPVAGEYYTLQTAVSRLIDYEKETGVTYRKKGLVISYRTAENVMETKQFQGEITGFGEIGLWKDFGGGSEVETADDPANDGKDALSTGGAYTHIPAGINIDTETEGVVKMKLVNAGGDDVGDEVQFTVGTGTGGSSGTTIAVAFESNPFYGKAGGSFIVKAAIMSVTKAGSQETTNSIMSVTFVNRTTKSSVAYFNPRKASSATLTDYSFEFDLSSLCADAGELPLQAIITDDGGNTATKNISLISIDVTCESVQTLNYTKETALQVGGNKMSIPMYRFPNNASDKGISVKVEIYKNSAWETIQEQVVNDTYPHNVSIDPTGLGHGSYPIRIQGTDVASGTKGNILHTAVMVIEQRESVSDYDKPIVVARWSDDSDGKVKLFETLKMDVAVYQRSTLSPTVQVVVTDNTTNVQETIASRVMYRSQYYTVEKRIVGYSDGDTLTFDAICGEASLTEKFDVAISGSLLAIAETEGALYKISLAGRSNTDTDKSIKTTATDGTEVAINVTGSNNSSNGFVADNYGTEQSNGRMSLRIAENVTAECTDTPFASTSIPTNGLALSLTFKVKNIAKRNARIIKCMGDRLGFVLTGEKFIVTTNGDTDEALASVFTTAATSYLDDTVYRFDIVIEPQSRAPYSGVMLCKVYQNGDMAACVPIDTSSSFPNFSDTIHFDGTDADLYLYEIVRWNSYYDFIQAFNNYIVNLTDTQAMLTEYNQNQVMSDVTAEGVTKPRPDMQKLLDRGVMVCVETRTSDKNLTDDGSAVTDSALYYPDYIEPLKDKKTKVLMDWYLYFPDRPWADCKIEAIPTTNQGTSTLAYAIKNKKGKAKKSKGITLLHTREEISQMYNGDEAILAKYDDAAALAKKKKIRIKEGSTPINTITIKVDYSDSAGANNCALMEMMNDVQIALGNNYKTPAQIFNTDNTEELHTSIDGITCALFRTDYKIGQDKGAEAATQPENAYFHAKANFNADKDNPHFFGFEDVPGYNKGCVNYGDFKEIVTPRGTDIDTYKATVLSNTASLIPGTLYMISEFCGPETRFIENDGTGAMTETDAVSDYTEVDKTGAEIAADSVKNYDWATVYKSNDGKYYKYTGGNWIDTTGSMTYDSTTGKWVIVGRVLNPVECYEYRQYQEFCWQQGVNSVDDMLKTLHTDDGDVPVWSTYYESRYPDDDDLNDLYAKGKKVPYQLYRELAFSQQCNQNLTDDATTNAALNADGSEKVFNGAGASTTITLDGETVAGTQANRLLKWQHEMHKYFSPYSTNCYVVTSDYKATVDQRAKNMMIAFYKETDGNVRGYFNHWYDGDSCDEADNDCYLTIPWDMDGATSHLYQGWDGVMFQQSYALFAKGEGPWIDDNGTMLTLHDTAAAMRATKTSAGLDIFSADACYRYWMTNRILKWPKVVSSFDGQRKYIETATAADNHYPALHGLRLESLPAFQRKRFAYRDGYYQTGDLFKHFFQARMMGAITVKITAAQDGYFAMGVDSTSSAKYSCYLKAGESHTFTEAAAGQGGKLIYIFGADKLSELDLSGCTSKNSNWMIADCTLLRKLVLGSDSYSPEYTDDILSALSLGMMPFLEELDIRNTKILTVNSSLCPRLKTLLATGSLLQTFTPAESSPIATLQLPATMTDVTLINLPKLTYPDGGLSYEGLSNVTNVKVSGCPNIDAVKLLEDVVSAGATVKTVSVAGINVIKNADLLQSLKSAGTVGLGSDDKTVCDGLSGKWVMKNYTDDDVLSTLQAYYPNLNLRQQLYSDYKEYDNTDDSENVTNTDNSTGYAFGNDYVASGHILKIYEKSVPVKGKFDKTTGKMHLTKMSESDYTKLADGSDFDNTDAVGEGYDCFMYIPHFWYKGVNDFLNQEKHTLLAYGATEPEATWSKKNEPKLSEILYLDAKGVDMSKATAGSTFADDSSLSDLSSCAVYRLDVERMKQARYIGLNNASYGACFVDADGKILEADAMAVTAIAASPLDFKNENGDYIFRTVPSGAKYLYFTCIRGLSDDDHQVLAVDSADIEAIEPGWEEHHGDLIGIYGGTVDSLGLLRSVSGKQTRRGDNTSSTSTEWTYDAEGNPTNMPVSTLHYTYQDLFNLCRYRGKGYHSISYEQSKTMAILSRCKCGNRNDQAVYGFGRNFDYTTGYLDSIGKSDTKYGQSNTNKIWGLEAFVACMWEQMDYVGVNIKTFASWVAGNRKWNDGNDPIDQKWHIWDPWKGAERVVQGVNSNNYNIARVKHGRYCDVIGSSFSTDTSKYSTGYAAGQWYSNDRGRCVGRASDNASAIGGLVFAVANSVSSSSYTGNGARLAFDGAIDNEDEFA